MKIIISHDIDHYYWSDHFFKDLYIPKYLTKNILYFVRGKIPLKLLTKRLSLLKSNRMGRLQEMTTFNIETGIPASYFMGVKNALNLSYNQKTAQLIFHYLKQKGFPLYLHGIEYRNKPRMIDEKSRFLKITGSSNPFGIRMHYLRSSADMTDTLSDLGYAFDSTEYSLKNPYFIGGMIEFPVGMMEVYVMSYSETDLEKVKQATKQRIQQARSANLRFFTIIFHDHHYSEAFPIHKAWYEWLIYYLKSEKFEFTDFAQAILQIQSERR